MKHLRFKKIIYSVLLLLPSFLTAQADLKDLEKISRSYKDAGSFQFDLYYSIFNDYHTRQKSDEFTMNIFSNGDEYYCKGNGSEMLINAWYTLIVDHDNKVVMIDKYKKKEKQKNEMFAEVGMDSLLQQITAQVKKKKTEMTSEQKNINEQEKQYIFNYSDGEYTTVKINYDASSFLIKKITLYYREKIETTEGQPETTPRVEIAYAHTVLHPQFDKKVFSEKKYGEVKKNGQLELRAELKNYNVINHLLK